VNPGPNAILFGLEAKKCDGGCRCKILGNFASRLKSATAAAVTNFKVILPRG
jgi:hypothetical protein